MVILDIAKRNPSVMCVDNFRHCNDRLARGGGACAAHDQGSQGRAGDDMVI
jgi:hypothetical protein